MKLIRGLKINRGNISTLKETRQYTVTGDKESVFSLQVKTSAGKFYNFSTNAFDTTETSVCRLKNQVLENGVYNGQIVFPADTDGETYTILLFAEPHFNTELHSDFVGDINGVVLQHNPTLYQVDITQVADVSVTFTVSGTSSNFSTATMAQSVIVSQSPTVNDPIKTTISWTINNIDDDLKGLGLVPAINLSDEVPSRMWHSASSFVIDDTRSDDGGGSSHFNYIVDSIDDLSVDMVVTSGAANGATLTQVYTSESNNPVVKFNTSKVLPNNTTIPVKGYGASTINKTTPSINVVFSGFELTQKPLTTTVRGTGNTDRTQVDVNGTYGIGKSEVVGVNTYVEGFGVNNSTDNPIRGVSAGEDDGYLILTTNQTLIEGTVLSIINSSNSYTLTGDITINKMPTSNKIIYLDLDKILTLGTSS